MLEWSLTAKRRGEALFGKCHLWEDIEVRVSQNVNFSRVIVGCSGFLLHCRLAINRCRTVLSVSDVLTIQMAILVETAIVQV